MSLTRYTAPMFERAVPANLLWTNSAGMILVGIFLGCLFVPLTTSLIIKAVVNIATFLQKMPIQEVLMGAFGLLFGLILSFFVNLALQSVSFATIPVVGDYIGPLIILFSTIFLGVLGAWFGSQLIYMHSLKQLLSYKGLVETRSILLDTSAIIDGRICKVRESGFLYGELIVPKFVLRELQVLSDSDEVVKRNRGRRGLDILNELRSANDIEISDSDYRGEHGVDAKLIRLATDMPAYICTTDYNLAKVASVQGVRILNLNILANALKPVIVAGEELELKVIKAGKDPNQGVGYLDDGTMVVVEGGRKFIGETVIVEIGSVVHTTAGRMFFAKCVEADGKEA